MKRTWILPLLIAGLGVAWLLREQGLPSRSEGTRAPPQHAPDAVRVPAANLQGREVAARTPVTEDAPPAATPWAVTGRVLGPGRFPAVGVGVRLEVEGRLRDQASTDGGGRYRLHPSGLPETGSSALTIVARNGEGHGAIVNCSVSLERKDDLQLGPMVLGLLHRLAVRVVSEGRPIAGAHVCIEGRARRMAGQLACADTDASGMAHFNSLPRGTVLIVARAEGLASRTIRAGVGQTPGEDEAIREIQLETPRSFEVQVVEAPDETPLANVVVRVFEHRAGLVGRSWQHVPVHLRRDIAPTDADGRTQIDGIGRSDTLVLGVEARGYATLDLDRATGSMRPRLGRYVPIPPDTDAIRIVIPVGRRATWPILEGDAPVPPDGTRVRLEGNRLPFGITEGRIEAAHLLIDDVGEKGFAARARTPEGLIAHPTLRMGKTLGSPISFTRSRTLEVEATPKEKPKPRELCIRILKNGVPSLPDRYRFVTTWDESFLRIESEAPGEGVLHAVWAPGPDEDGATFTITAPRFAPASFGVALGQEEVQVDLQTACSLQVVVLRPPHARPRWNLEHWNLDTAGWERHPSQLRAGVWPLEGEVSGVVLLGDDLEPGRYRAVGREAGRRSAEVVLRAGEPPATITLDLIQSPSIEGHVVAPKGAAFEGAYVECRADGTVHEVKLDTQGRFETPWPRDATEVRLVARHPLLCPHVRRGRVTLRGPREEITLELTQGPVAEFGVTRAEDDAALRRPPTAPRILLLRPGQDPVRLPARVDVQEDGTWRVAFSGFTPGRWSVWTSLSYRHAPIRIADAILHDIGAVLGDVPLRTGSRIRIRVHTPDDKPPLILAARAEYADRPPHERTDMVEGVDEIVLQGLEAGRYRVRAGRVDAARDEIPADLDEIIEVDGRSTYERDIDLR